MELISDENKQKVVVAMVQEKITKNQAAKRFNITVEQVRLIMVDMNYAYSYETRSYYLNQNVNTNNLKKDKTVKESKNEDVLAEISELKKRVAFLETKLNVTKEEFNLIAYKRLYAEMEQTAIKLKKSGLTTSKSFRIPIYVVEILNDFLCDARYSSENMSFLIVSFILKGIKDLKG